MERSERNLQNSLRTNPSKHVQNPMHQNTHVKKSSQIEHLKNNLNDQDMLLNDVEQGVGELQLIAIEMSEETKKQDALVEDLSKGVDGATGSVITLNNLVKTAIEKSGGECRCALIVFFIVMIFILILILVYV